MTVQRLNCAIYTRKSTDEGLDMAFNSLEAQREACESYIASQKHEGWKAIPTLYDDGGYSGGSMERPALRRLMADIEAGRVNVVVVYKVDRLTRSLADFAKMVETFDKYGVSFVSVTQQFNTTTSMGRLTLNVLLSFAQFEREVTGERIRDKVAASKAKGMWMGGRVPLGYKVQDRKLHIVPEQAEQVRYIFERYLELGSVYALCDELAAAGASARSFTRGMLYTMLQNPIYTGKVRHRGKIYDGQHDAIVDDGTWQQVQAMLESNRNEYKGRVRTNGMLLTGRVFDERGNRLTPSATNRKGRRYGYYVTPVSVKPVLRIPAGDLDKIVSEKSNNIDTLERVVVSPERITLHMKGDEAEIIIPYRFAKSGPYHQILVDDQASTANTAQKEVLRKLVVQGMQWRERMFGKDEVTLQQLAAETGTHRRDVIRIINIGLLAPDIIERILKGDIPPTLTRRKLCKTLPLEWDAQRAYLV